MHGRGVSPPTFTPTTHKLSDVRGEDGRGWNRVPVQESFGLHGSGWRHSLDQTKESSRYRQEDNHDPNDVSSWLVLSSESPNARSVSVLAEQILDSSVNSPDVADNATRIRPYRQAREGELKISGGGEQLLAGQGYLVKDTPLGRAFSDTPGFAAGDEIFRYGGTRRDGLATTHFEGGGLAESDYGSKLSAASAVSSTAAPASRHNIRWASDHKSGGPSDAIDDSARARPSLQRPSDSVLVDLRRDRCSVGACIWHGKQDLRQRRVILARRACHLPCHHPVHVLPDAH